MKKITKYVPLFFAFYVIGFWVISSLQFLHYYYQFGIYDVSIVEFLIFIVPLFLPLLTFGALIVSYYIKKLRLYIWMRNNLTITEYDIDMPPAETGLVIDYFSNSNEVIGTLLDLHFRGVINMEVRGQSLYLKNTKDLHKNLSAYEEELATQIFKYENYQTFQTCDDKYLRRCGRLAHKKLITWANETNSLMQVIPKKVKPAVPYLLILAFVGFLVSLVSVWVLIFDYESATTLGPNTYPVHPIELGIVYVISMWGLIILLSSFWPRFSTNHKSKPVETWIKANGLKMYLKTVHSDRFSVRNVSKQASSEIKKYAPYMITLNLAPCDTNYLKQILVKK